MLNLCTKKLRNINPYHEAKLYDSVSKIGVYLWSWRNSAPTLSKDQKATYKQWRHWWRLELRRDSMIGHGGGDADWASQEVDTDDAAVNLESIPISEKIFCCGEARTACDWATGCGWRRQIEWSGHESTSRRRWSAVSGTTSVHAGVPFLVQVQKRPAHDNWQHVGIIILRPKNMWERRGFQSFCLVYILYW